MITRGVWRSVKTQADTCCISPFSDGQDNEAGKNPATPRNLNGGRKMIVYKTWLTYDNYRIAYSYDGWFLLGIIPLYIRRFK